MGELAIIKENSKSRAIKIQQLILEDLIEMQDDIKSLHVDMTKNYHKNNLEHEDMRNKIDTLTNSLTISGAQENKIKVAMKNRARILKPKRAKSFYLACWNYICFACGVSEKRDIPWDKLELAISIAQTFSKSRYGFYTDAGQEAN